MLDRDAATRAIEGALGPLDLVILGYLYGSFLSGPEFEDVDVGVVLSQDLAPYERFKYAMEIGRVLERALTPRHEVDVKILNAAPIGFQYEVIRTGTPAFVRDGRDRVRYEADLISTWLDFKETSDWMDEQFLRW